MLSMPVPTVLVILANGFEEVEAVTPIDVLRRAGAEVTVATTGDGVHVTGRNRVTLHADTTLSAVAGAEFDCVVLPGGPGVSLLRNDSRVLDIVRRQHARGGWIAAICAAPVVLKAAGILDGMRFTAHFSVGAELPDALQDERVVLDGKLITSRGAGTSLDFALLLAEQLFSREKASEIARSISA
jgi:4-methyl-5(b-hydroxyethyl)-thiazole monophosphate biosynthesis